MFVKLYEIKGILVVVIVHKTVCIKTNGTMCSRRLNIGILTFFRISQMLRDTHELYATIVLYFIHMIWCTESFPLCSYNLK